MNGGMTRRNSVLLERHTGGDTVRQLVTGDEGRALIREKCCSVESLKSLRVRRSNNVKESTVESPGLCAPSGCVVIQNNVESQV